MMKEKSFLHATVPFPINKRFPQNRGDNLFNSNNKNTPDRLTLKKGVKSSFDSYDVNELAEDYLLLETLQVDDELILKGLVKAKQTDSPRRCVLGAAADVCVKNTETIFMKIRLATSNDAITAVKSLIVIPGLLTIIPAIAAAGGILQFHSKAEQYQGCFYIFFLWLKKY